jgi:hypothetical protein
MVGCIVFGLPYFSIHVWRNRNAQEDSLEQYQKQRSLFPFLCVPMEYKTISTVFYGVPFTFFKILGNLKIIN